MIDGDKQMVRPITCQAFFPPLSLFFIVKAPAHFQTASSMDDFPDAPGVENHRACQIIDLLEAAGEPVNSTTAYI